MRDIIDEDEYSENVTSVTNSDTQNEKKFKPWDMDKKSFLLLMHLSPFASVIVPAAGIVLPILMWSQFKDQDTEIDIHGKNVLNWMISSCIYAMASIPLIFLFGIGVLTLIAVMIVSTIFSIMGAVKANEGIVYNYPLTIKFIK